MKSRSYCRPPRVAIITGSLIFLLPTRIIPERRTSIGCRILCIDPFLCRSEAHLAAPVQPHHTVRQVALASRKCAYSHGIMHSSLPWRLHAIAHLQSALCIIVRQAMANRQNLAASLQPLCIARGSFHGASPFVRADATWDKVCWIVLS